MERKQQQSETGEIDRQRTADGEPLEDRGIMPASRKGKAAAQGESGELEIDPNPPVEETDNGPGGDV